MQKNACCSWQNPAAREYCVLQKSGGAAKKSEGSPMGYAGTQRKKLPFLGLVISLLLSFAASSQKITLSGKNLSVKEVFTAVEKQTGYFVWGKAEYLEQSRKVSIHVKNMSLDSFLNKALKDQPFTYRIAGNTIILSGKNDVATPATQPPAAVVPAISLANISGLVLNAENSEIIKSASIAVKGQAALGISDNAGHFAIAGLSYSDVLVISSIGFTSIEIPLSVLQRMVPEQTVALQAGSVRKIPTGVYIFSLAANVEKLQDVVISNGMFSRKKESYTGAASVFTGAELRSVGNKNILESLKTLDPSFIIVEDNLQGSNPNRLPKIEIRGRTTLTNANLNDQFNADPNQPLFIMDGFETTLQTIFDLDMNRIASITILKDAASTALYGSKAANGVVVVETKRPVPGKLQTSYVGDFSFDFPDLGSYNLMNASERLQYEELVSAGYTTNFADPTAWRREERNSARRADVQRGVNTYWLHEPVQTGFNNKHSLQLNGGNNDLSFNAGGMYSRRNGVMKGSDKESWGGNMSINYRKGKLNITEMATVSGSKGNESPYGSFWNFATANPYYRKTGENGYIAKKLDPLYDTGVVNPLYNASLFSINQNTAFNFINNLRGMYSVTNTVRVESGLQFSKGNGRTVVFIPPDNTDFDGVEAQRKGSYTSTHLESQSYNAYLALAYGQAFGKSRVSANVRGQVESTTSEMIGFSIVGYPYGTNGNPSFAYGYTPYSTPSASKATSRGTSFSSSVNYTFDNRFLADVVYTLSGSSAFGSNKRFKPFVSGGLGWNIHEEPFMRQIQWINLLKLRGNIGYSGNQNLGNFTSVSTYAFQGTGGNYFGQGLSLASLGSPNLEWSKTLQGSYGLDITLMKGRVSGSLEYFRKQTDPLSVGAEGTLPSSVALNNTYVINVGTLTTSGWNLNLRYSPIYNLQKRIIWTISVSGVKNTSVYGGFGNRLEALNKQEQESNGLLRYYDGYSPDDIWAVKSLGIDPANGMELFEKKDGSVTYSYNPADIVRVGNMRPKLEGIVTTTVTYKDFTFGASARYRIGGYVFNSALYNKVENVSGTDSRFTLTNQYPNLDRRALYDRWQQPGDVTEFTSIAAGNVSPMSGRYVQKDSHFIGESINVSWRTSASWIKKLNLQNLGVSFYLNDIFRLETVQSERGIDYPFSRAGSFSVTAFF